MIQYKILPLEIQEEIDNYVKINVKKYFVYVLHAIKLNKKNTIKNNLINIYIKNHINKIDAFDWFENDFHRWLNNDIPTLNYINNRYINFYKKIFNIEIVSDDQIINYCTNNLLDSEYLINTYFNYLSISEIEEFEEFIFKNIYY